MYGVIFEFEFNIGFIKMFGKIFIKEENVGYLFFYEKSNSELVVDF